MFGLAGEKSQLLFARSTDGSGQMNELIRPALASLGGRGGGTAVVAQGGGPSASETDVCQAIDLAFNLLQKQL